jgi:hypothetical protein
MISIYEKENFGQSDIDQIIQNQMEESTYLEFKSSNSLDNTDRNKKEISKDISAFANSDGGLIIYGIKENDHKADSVDFINGRVITKEWIENVIDSNIKRIIPGLKIFPIRFSNDLEKTIYIIKIPSSISSPHMANDNRYYRRANYKILPLEEYEIRNQYNKKLVTKLVFEDLIINSSGTSRVGERLKSINYTISIQIKNIGFAIEKDYKIEIRLHNRIYEESMPAYNPLNKYLIREEKEFKIFSIPNSSPIFQNEITTITSFFLTFNRSNFEFLSNYGLDIKLYFTSGVEEKCFLIHDRLEYIYGPMKYEDFV